MSFYDYQASRQINAHDYSFYSLIMAAMRKADTCNISALKHAFPATYAEFDARYNAPGGVLPTDPEFTGVEL